MSAYRSLKTEVPPARERRAQTRDSKRQRQEVLKWDLEAGLRKPSRR
jgi:hypothetical protein